MVVVLAIAETEIRSPLATVVPDVAVAPFLKYVFPDALVTSKML
jgi:hypothetical protein